MIGTKELLICVDHYVKVHVAGWNSKCYFLVTDFNLDTQMAKIRSSKGEYIVPISKLWLGRGWKKIVNQFLRKQLST
jgi:hypothetical protein